jgi:hypothetical protein
MLRARRETSTRKSDVTEWTRYIALRKGLARLNTAVKHGVS